MRIYYFIIAVSFSFSLQASALHQLDTSKWSMQIFWLIVIFAGLYIALYKIALPQVSETIASRENRIVERLEDARRLFDEAQQRETKQNDSLIKARNESQEIRQTAQQKINDYNQTELTKLNDQIEAKLTQAEEDIAKQVAEVQKNIDNTATFAVKDTFLHITGKVISEEKALETIQKIGGYK